MSNKGQLLQDPFLNTLRKEHVPVSIYLVNGIKLQGQIESFDQYVVLLRNSVTQMVYKHAISTVVPSRPISLGRRQGSRVAGSRFPARDAPPQPPIPRRRSSSASISATTHYEESVEEVVRLVRERRRARATAWCRASAQRPDPKLYAGSGKVEEIARAAEELNADVRGLQPRAVAGAGAQPREGARAARDGPHRADPGDLRAARADQRGQAAGRAGAARAPVDAPGARLDPPRAPARRPRQDRRPGREAARARPALHRAAASRC